MVLATIFKTRNGMVGYLSHNQLLVWASEGPGASKLIRFQITTKHVKANMMNISIESLSLIVDMVSVVKILRNSSFFDGLQ